MPVLADYLAWSGSATFSEAQLEGSNVFDQFYDILTFPSGLAGLGTNPLLAVAVTSKYHRDAPPGGIDFFGGLGVSVSSNISSLATSGGARTGPNSGTLGVAPVTWQTLYGSYLRSPELTEGGTIIVDFLLSVGEFGGAVYPAYIEGVVVAAIFRDLEGTPLSSVFPTVISCGSAESAAGGALPLTLNLFNPAPYIAAVFYGVDTQGGGTPPAVTMENAPGWEDAIYATQGDRGALLGLYMPSENSLLTTTFTGASSGYQGANALTNTRSAGRSFAQIVG